MDEKAAGAPYRKSWFEQGSRWLPWALAALCLIKFWVIWPYEVTDDTDDPIVYIAQVENPTVGACYGPGTGIFGNLLYHSGVSYRLGLELVFQFALFLQVAALLGWPQKNCLALIAYAVALFNPLFADVSSHLLSDPVWSIFIMIGLSMWVLFCSNLLSWASYGPACAFIFLAALTRPLTMPLLVCLAATLFVGLGFNYLGATANKGQLARRFAIVILFFMVAIYLPYKTWVSFSPYRGTSSIDSAAFVTFYMTLQGVGPGDGLPYFPIDEKRRELISSAGPLSKKMMDAIDDSQGPCSVFWDCGVANYGVHDIPEGWMQCAIQAEAPSTMPAQFIFYQRIEEEIHNAHEEGRLPMRFILPLPDARLDKVLSVLPENLFAAINALGIQPPVYAWSFGKTAFTNPEFTRFLNRRKIQPDAVHEALTHGLCRVYQIIYAPLSYALVAAVIGCAFIAMKKRSQLRPSLAFLSQQCFLALFVGLFACYVIFAASGLPLVLRYLTYHSVLMPILAIYYGKLLYELLLVKQGKMNEISNAGGIP